MAANNNLDQRQYQMVVKLVDILESEIAAFENRQENLTIEELCQLASMLEKIQSARVLQTQKISNDMGLRFAQHYGGDVGWVEQTD